MTMCMCMCMCGSTISFFCMALLDEDFRSSASVCQPPFLSRGPIKVKRENVVSEIEDLD